MVDMLPRWSWSNVRHEAESFAHSQTYSPPWQTKSDSHSPPSSVDYDDQLVPPAQPHLQNPPASDRHFHSNPNSSRILMTNNLYPSSSSSSSKDPSRRMSDPLLIGQPPNYPPRYHPPFYEDNASPTSNEDNDPYNVSPPGTADSVSPNPPNLSPEPGRSPDTGSDKTYSFVSLPGSTIRKRPRRRYDEIERLYRCNWPECTKAYGTLNHLNAHVTMQKHGHKRSPAEFKELRKLWRKQKKEAETAKMMKGEEVPAHLDHHHRPPSTSYHDPQGPPSVLELQTQHHRQNPHPTSLMDHRLLPSGRYSSSTENLRIGYQPQVERWPSHPPAGPSTPISPTDPFSTNLASGGQHVRVLQTPYVSPQYPQPRQSQPYPSIESPYRHAPRYPETVASTDIPYHAQPQQPMQTPHLLPPNAYATAPYAYEGPISRIEGYSQPSEYRTD